MSRETIVAAALGMIEDDGLQAFSMPKLARRVGSSVMGIYTYFAGRDALLDAVSEKIFDQFEMPSSSGSWQEGLTNWVSAVSAVFECHPSAIRLIKWDEHISPAWYKMWVPMMRILAAEGLSGERLSFASFWFGSSVMGMISFRVAYPQTRAASILTDRSVLGAADRALVDDANNYMSDEQPREIFAFSLQGLLRELRVLIDEARAQEG